MTYIPTTWEYISKKGLRFYNKYPCYFCFTKLKNTDACWYMLDDEIDSFPFCSELCFNCYVLENI
jgi:hypothetical protein